MNALQAANAEIRRLHTELRNKEAAWRWLIKVNKRWQSKCCKACAALRKAKISIDKGLEGGK